MQNVQKVLKHWHDFWDCYLVRVLFTNTLQKMLQVAVRNESRKDCVARQRMQDVFIFCRINKSSYLFMLSVSITARNNTSDY